MPTKFMMVITCSGEPITSKWFEIDEVVLKEDSPQCRSIIMSEALKGLNVDEKDEEDFQITIIKPPSNLVLNWTLKLRFEETTLVSHADDL